MDEKYERQRHHHLITFFVEDLIFDALKKNGIYWNLARSEYLERVHAEVPSGYKLDDYTSRSVLYTLGEFAEQCREESVIVREGLAGLEASRKHSGVREVIEVMTSRYFYLQQGESFIVFLAAMISIIVDLWKAGKIELIPVIIIAVVSLIEKSHPNNTEEFFGFVENGCESVTHLAVLAGKFDPKQ